jgi:hypothetical protein
MSISKFTGVLFIMSVVNGEFPVRGIFFRLNLRRVFAVKFVCVRVCHVCV